MLASVWQNFVTPSRFFGLSPSRRASFSTSGEGSEEEASVAALAGFEAVAEVSVPTAAVAGAVAGAGAIAGTGAVGGAGTVAGAGAVGEEEAVEEAGLADEVALVGVASDAGDWAPHGAATTSMSDARRAI
jgi:hypothetical protein